MAEYAILIVDDEPLARKHIRTLLRDRSGLGVVGECRNGFEAVDAILELRPDLVFLDIQMPDLDGFGVIEAVGVHQMPAIVFVTAHDAHAVSAFEVNALDYLLKPFSDERFELALDKASRSLAQHRLGALAGDWMRLLDFNRHARSMHGPGERWPRRLPVPGRKKVALVEVSEIDWIEAEGPYVALHCGAKTHLVRDSLKRLETTLNPAQFMRIHRSTMVNLERIDALAPSPSGGLDIHLASGARLKASRPYRERLRRHLGLTS